MTDDVDAVVRPDLAALDPVAMRDDHGDLRPEFVEAVSHAIAGEDAGSLRAVVSELHEADLGDLIKALDSDERVRLVELTGADFDFSALNDWHFEISDTVRKLVTNLPDAAKPESDAYMTSLAIVLLRQSNVPVADPRIHRGLAWLRREQRETGRWWMHSLYRGNYHYITYIATAQALKAFDLCGELSVAGATPARAQP